jgi:transposase
MIHETVVGLDVHADSITAAILPSKSDTPSCYEASGAGFVLQRLLVYDGFSCEVIAPSLIPRKPGDHRKTDRLDAIMLARLYRSGHLTVVHVPDEDHEDLRRLLRLRETYHAYCTATMHRISAILRNHGHVFKQGKSTWTKKHRRWLRELRQSLQGPLQTALATELEHLEYLETQQTALDAELERYASLPLYRKAVEALCCLRGVKTLTALTLLVEIGDVRRFRSPRSLMAYFGLVPSEYSSGSREYRGSITKAGNVHVRRLLVEAAWNNRHNAAAALILKRRRQGQPPDVVALPSRPSIVWSTSSSGLISANIVMWPSLPSPENSVASCGQSSWLYLITDQHSPERTASKGEFSFALCGSQPAFLERECSGRTCEDAVRLQQAEPAHTSLMIVEERSPLGIIFQRT